MTAASTRRFMDKSPGSEYGQPLAYEFDNDNVHGITRSVAPPRSNLFYDSLQIGTDMSLKYRGNTHKNPNPSHTEHKNQFKTMQVVVPCA